MISGIPAAPWCPRNEAYAANVRDAFRTGESPDRFREQDLNETGRRGLGL